jgi:hypothetical protein
MVVDARIWVQAERETQTVRSRIQGFFYPARVDLDGKIDVQELPGKFVIRDFNRCPDEQYLWTLEVSDHGYAEGSERMSEELRVEEIAVISMRYNELMAGEGS